ncbi:MAG: DNA-directed RNA polymerase subunit omega, partial [Clostridiales bacterium]|nr:DNA-directed RNA polymerase subunit omega [Clostridiales bacterium]
MFSLQCYACPINRGNFVSMASLSEKVGCRYTLVVETSKRARQLLAGALSLIDTINMKPLRIAEEKERLRVLVVNCCSGIQ